LQDETQSRHPILLAPYLRVLQRISGYRHRHGSLAVEVWTGRGLISHYLLFVISLADRVVPIAGVTTRPDESWMLQLGRNLCDAHSGALCAKYMIIDRDSKYSEQFRRLIRDSGTKFIRLPPMSPLGALLGSGQPGWSWGDPTTTASEISARIRIFISRTPHRSYRLVGT